MRQKIIDILTDHNDEADYEHEENIVDEGYIDSLSLTAIIIDLQEAFGVRIPPAKIIPENFNSVEAIMKMLQSLGS